MKYPREFYQDGTAFVRVTIRFEPGKAACQARAYVADVLSRAHGFRTNRSLTDRLARSGGRFVVPVAEAKAKTLRRRLRLLVDAGLIALFIRGKRVSPRI